MSAEEVRSKRKGARVKTHLIGCSENEAPTQVESTREAT